MSMRYYGAVRVYEGWTELEDGSRYAWYQKKFVVRVTQEGEVLFSYLVRDDSFLMRIKTSSFHGGMTLASKIMGSQSIDFPSMAL